MNIVYYVYYDVDFKLKSKYNYHSRFRIYSIKMVSTININLRGFTHGREIYKKTFWSIKKQKVN